MSATDPMGPNAASVKWNISHHDPWRGITEEFALLAEENRAGIPRKLLAIWVTRIRVEF